MRCQCNYEIENNLPRTKYCTIPCSYQIDWDEVDKKNDTCTACEEGEIEHECPLKSEIEGDDTPCTCCEACTQECMDSV